MSTQLPWRCSHGGFGYVQSHGAQTRRHTDKMSIWGEGKWWQKPYVLGSHKYSVAGAESPSLKPLCKHNQSIYTSAHGEIPQAASEQEENEQKLLSFHPVPPLAGGQQAAFQNGSDPQAEFTTERAAPGVTEAHRGSSCWQGYARGGLKSSKAVRGDRAQTPRFPRANQT